MKNILITGATGFIGSHLADFLKKQNFQVFALVRKTSKTQHLKQLGVQLVTAELTNQSALQKAFEKLGAQKIKLDIVVHGAGLINAKTLEEFMEVNCYGTQKLLDVLEKYQPGLERFILISSLAASGPTKLGEVVPIKKESPITDYGHSKLAAEAWVKKSKFSYFIFRPTAVFGPREKDIFTLFSIIKKGVQPKLGNHPQQLTFIYAKDLVALIVKSFESKMTNKTYFASDGKVYAKEDFGKYVSQCLKKKTIKITIPLWMLKGIAFTSQTAYRLRKKLSPINLERYKDLKAQSWACEIEPTFDDLNFQPKYSLEEGVAETAEWYLKEGWL